MILEFKRPGRISHEPLPAAPSPSGLSPELRAMVAKGQAKYVRPDDYVPDYAQDDPDVIEAEADVWGIAEGILAVPGGDRVAALAEARQRLKAAVAACEGHGAPVAS